MSKTVPVELTPKMIRAARDVEVGVLEHIDPHALREGKLKVKLSPVKMGDEQLKRLWKAFLDNA